MTTAIIILLIVALIEFVLSNIDVTEETTVQAEPIEQPLHTTEPEKAFETKFLNESETNTITWEVKNNS